MAGSAAWRPILRAGRAESGCSIRQNHLNCLYARSRRSRWAGAAFLAISFRLPAEKLGRGLSRPLVLGAFPSATAAGFLPASGFGNADPSRRFPMACSTTRRTRN